MLTPYKLFGKVITKEDVEAYVAEPMKMVAWVAKNIQVNKECNLGAPPVSPEGVWKACLADAHSRDIFFVSMARSMGVPARIDEVTGKVQLITDDGAIECELRSSRTAPAQRAGLQLHIHRFSHWIIRNILQQTKHPPCRISSSPLLSGSKECLCSHPHDNAR